MIIIERVRTQLPIITKSKFYLSLKLERRTYIPTFFIRFIIKQKEKQ